MCLFPSWQKSYDKPRQCTEKQRLHFANKGLSSQSCGFSSSHVWMWELNHKEDWALKNWGFWTVVLEKTLESPLDCKEIQPVNPKRSQSEYSLEVLILKLKLQYFGHLMRRTDFLEKTLMLGKIEGRRRRGQQRMRWLDGITDSMDMLLLLLSRFSRVRLLATPRTIAYQAPPSSPVLCHLMDCSTLAFPALCYLPEPA